MAVIDDPAQSRRLATALQRMTLSADERGMALRAGKRAATWQDLPQWLRDKVADTEQGA
jgi:hypothetical protein